jgi:putative DNA primase/helicase
MSSAAEIIQRLGGNRSGMCHCPAHNDTTPSLHVTERGGKVLVKCHAGCSQEQVIGALKARGLWEKGQSTSRVWTEYPPDQEKYHHFHEALAILRAGTGAIGRVREWRRADAQKELLPYFNGRGIDKVPINALYLSKKESRRLTGKGFPAMVMPIINNNGRLQGAQVTFLSRDRTCNLRGKDKKSIRWFYGSSKGGYIQLGELDPAKPLVVAEGVESALSAARITGFPAIAALGAGNMKDLILPPSSHVVIAADYDESGTGEAAAEELAQRLTTIGRVVRIVVPWKDGVKKYDFNDQLRDALNDGIQLASLRDDILAIEPFEGVSDVQELVKPLGMEQFIDLRFPPRQFLLKPWLTTTGLVMIDAQPGHGKTWLALSIAHAVASGEPLMDWAVERRGRVLYVDGELPGELLQMRLRMLGAPLPASGLLVLSRAQFEMHGALMPDLGEEAGREFLDKIIKEHEIDLVILDSVTTLVRSGMDNDVESWRAIQDWSLKHRAHGRAVIYLHHHGRSGNPRGTSAREIVLDARIKLVRDADLTTEKETAFKLEFPKAREFHGADAAPMIAYFSTQSGVVEWWRESVKDNTRDRVKEMSSQGWKATDIAKELGLSKGRISQIMKEIRTRDAAKEKDVAVVKD